jgi:membrane associated rhomboid family serine protease
MIPLRDVLPTRTTPWVTYVLIALNAVVYVHEATLSDRAFEAFVFRYGLVPAHFSWASAVTSMFSHESLLHVGSNMWCLWIFGDNVEDRFGHGRFLVFYLLAGFAAIFAQVWADPASTVPLIGASGAIAGVMGAYFVMFPKSRILVLIPLIIFFDVIEVPAVVFLGFWVLLQLAGGVLGLFGPANQGGVAFWAHVGGFAAGLLCVWVFRRPERARVEWWSGRES